MCVCVCVCVDSDFVIFIETILFKRKNIRHLTFTAAQTSPYMHLCDWSRAIVGKQSEYTRHTTLGSVFGVQIQTQ